MLLKDTFLPKRKTMNLGEDENFAFKHPYFFDEFNFKIIGYKPRIKKALEDIVKDMGGQISDDASYILTDHFYFYLIDGKRNLYSINYLSHSIAAEVPLDIEHYKFADLGGDSVNFECSCLDIKNILMAKFCHTDNFDSVKCSLCIQTDVMVLDDLSSTNLHDNEKNSTSSHKSVTNAQMSTNNNSQTTENNEMYRTGVSRWKRKEAIDLSYLVTRSSDCPAKKSRNIDRTCNTSNNGLKDIAITKENLNREQWWLYLPPGINPNPMYKEPELIEESLPEREYLFHEKRKMITFLVVNNLIENFDKRSTWRKMHRDGHLRQKSLDSLKNHIKLIISDIKSFNLPKNIEDQFLLLKQKIVINNISR